MHPKQIEAVLRMPGPKRFEHFVKEVADREVVWALYNEGWALAGTDDGTRVFPMWPASEYAQLCASGEWTMYQPKQIPIDELRLELLPRFQKAGILPGIFYTPNDRGITLSVQEFKEALEAELSRY